METMNAPMPPMPWLSIWSAMTRYESRTESASAPADVVSCRNGLAERSSALRNSQRFSSVQVSKFSPSGMLAALSS